jgi:hypothetical protein
MRSTTSAWRSHSSLPRGVTLLPAYARNFLPLSVSSRPLEGETPTIDLVIGYQKANRSPILALFLWFCQGSRQSCRCRKHNNKSRDHAP